MNRRKYSRFLTLPLAVLLGCLTQPALAVFDPLEEFYGDADRSEFEDFDESLVKQWEEAKIEQLTLPGDEALLKVDIDNVPPGLELFIDAASLELNEQDGVLRFWLVAKSRSGAYNASYEGFRCETREYKVYAYGNPRRDQQVRKAPKPQWRSVRGRGLLNYRKELYLTLLCDDKGPRAVSVITDTLKGHREYRHPGSSDRTGW